MRLIARPYVPGIAAGRLLYWWQKEQDLSDRVVVLREVSPEEVLELTARRPAGAVVLGYRPFSHVLIHLFSREIPAVMIAEDDAPREGDWCFIDGSTGELEIGKRADAVKWRGSQDDTASFLELMGQESAAQTQTLDGEAIVIEASVSSTEGVACAKKAGAAAIGLVRSEFLVQTGKMPPAVADYAKAAQALLKAAAGMPVSWRMLDVGGEKIFPWMKPTAAVRDSLGMRGSRAYRLPLIRSVVDCQLRALAEVDTEHRVTLLAPFVSSPEEFLDVRRVVEQTGQSHAGRVGAMLETPAACLLAPEIGRLADVLAIGTNDLTQAFFAASRSCSEAAPYVDPYSPALIRFLASVAALCASRLESVRICGQLPLLPHVLEYLIGLGFRRFSLEPLALPGIVRRCGRVDSRVMKVACDQAMASGDSKGALLRIASTE